MRSAMNSRGRSRPPRISAIRGALKRKQCDDADDRESKGTDETVERGRKLTDVRGRKTTWPTYSMTTYLHLDEGARQGSVRIAARSKVGVHAQTTVMKYVNASKHVGDALVAKRFKCADNCYLSEALSELDIDFFIEYLKPLKPAAWHHDVSYVAALVDDAFLQGEIDEGTAEAWAAANVAAKKHAGTVASAKKSADARTSSEQLVSDSDWLTANLGEGSCEGLRGAAGTSGEESFKEDDNYLIALANGLFDINVGRGKRGEKGVKTIHLNEPQSKAVRARLTVITDADNEFLLTSKIGHMLQKDKRAKTSGRLPDGAPAQLHSSNNYRYQDAEDARLLCLFLDASTQLAARAKRHAPVVNGMDTSLNMLFSTYFHGAGAVFNQDNRAALTGLFLHVLG
ncbi:hypothetical protein T492DRAFT_835699 [Pavlovales sp. CCMP2436]|nr:hypothetical protein T492DRAFT_835699 [Pavlovales sp. CCMP2436]